MNQFQTKVPSKSVEKIIWQSAISPSKKPKPLLSTSSVPISAQSNARPYKKLHPFFKKKSSLINPPKTPEKLLKDSSKFYSIKYLGITKGQIGILSKRTRIPELSPMETCKDVPLALINSSISETGAFSKSNLKSSSKTFRKFQESEVNFQEKEELAPDPNNVFVIHTYARPRGLVSVHKSHRKENFLENARPVALQVQRNGLSGWKLTRPKTTSPIANRKALHVKEDLKVQCKHINAEEVYGEPYLKFLETSKLLKKRQSSGPTHKFVNPNQILQA